MEKQNKRLSYTILKDTLPILISLIALVVAIKSCQQTNQESENQRQVFFKAVFDKDDSTFTINSLNNQAYLQRAKIYFPTKLDSQPWFVSQSDETIPLHKVINQIERLIRNNLKKASKGIFSRHNNIPIIIASDYLSNGVKVFDISFYSSDYDFTLITEGEKLLDLDWNYLRFITKISLNDDKVKFLDKEWGKETKEFQFKHAEFLTE